jgi:steroid 5-alpha reductase family enzyme
VYIVEKIKMLRTILILLITLLLIPISAIYFDKPLNELQWHCLNVQIAIYLAVAIGCFVVSEITRNCSQVDKLWSIIPLVYTWYMAYASDFNSRLTLMAIVTTIWGARLTYNFARRGGYSWIPWAGEEDYRWAVLREQPLLSSRFAWGLFGFSFISLYQQGLILLFTLPTLIALEGAVKPLGWLDYLCATLIIGLVVIEYIADQQQYDFQTEKHRRIATGEALGDYEHGFTNTGLWAKSRHPNYAAEQAIWFVFYFFSVAATDRPLNWTLAGSILLMLLFLGSSDFSEKISVAKYPKYSDYQAKVSRFLPF